MSYKVGDLDNDGTPGTINDIVLLARYNINGDWTLRTNGLPDFVADIDGDGEYATINDVVKLARGEEKFDLSQHNLIFLFWDKSVETPNN